MAATMEWLSVDDRNEFIFPPHEGLEQWRVTDNGNGWDIVGPNQHNSFKNIHSAVKWAARMIGFPEMEIVFLDEEPYIDVDVLMANAGESKSLIASNIQSWSVDTNRTPNALMRLARDYSTACQEYDWAVKHEIEVIVPMSVTEAAEILERYADGDLPRELLSAKTHIILMLDRGKELGIDFSNCSITLPMTKAIRKFGRPIVTKPTKGPWRVFEADQYMVVSPDKTMSNEFNIAFVDSRVSDDEEEIIANARLIAAAPELLEALELCLATMGVVSPEGAIAVMTACAAIAKSKE